MTLGIRFGSPFPLLSDGSIWNPGAPKPGDLRPQRGRHSRYFHAFHRRLPQCLSAFISLNAPGALYLLPVLQLLNCCTLRPQCFAHPGIDDACDAWPSTSAPPLPASPAPAREAPRRGSESARHWLAAVCADNLSQGVFFC